MFTIAIRDINTGKIINESIINNHLSRLEIAKIAVQISGSEHLDFCYLTVHHFEELTIKIGMNELNKLGYYSYSKE